MVGCLFMILVYIIPILIICIDKYRFFDGEKIKDYFKTGFSDGIYFDGMINMAIFLPGLNIFFALFRIIVMMFILLSLLSNKFGFTKILKKIINIKIK